MGGLGHLRMHVRLCVCKIKIVPLIFSPLCFETLFRCFKCFIFLFMYFCKGGGAFPFQEKNTAYEFLTSNEASECKCSGLH